MNLLCVAFYCVGLIEYILAGKTLLNYTNLFSFSLNDYRKNCNIIYMFLEINTAEEASLKFRLRKIDEARNYL